MVRDPKSNRSARTRLADNAESLTPAQSRTIYAVSPARTHAGLEARMEGVNEDR